jgi:hypothetical protein
LISGWSITFTGIVIDPSPAGGFTSELTKSTKQSTCKDQSSSPDPRRWLLMHKQNGRPAHPQTGRRDAANAA